MYDTHDVPTWIIVAVRNWKYKILRFSPAPALRSGYHLSVITLLITVSPDSQTSLPVYQPRY